LANKYSPYPGDIVDAKLEPGEFVLNRNAVDAVGVDQLKKLNDEVAPRFAAQRGKYVPPKIIHNEEEGYSLEMYPDTDNKKDRYNFSSFGDKHVKRMTDWTDEANKKFPITEKNKFGFLPWVDKEKYVEYEGGTDANYHRQKYLYDNQLEHSRMIYDFHKGPKPMKLRRGQKPLHIDLQKAEIPTGDQFNTDDFNSMLGAKKTMDDFFVRQDMVDSSGRTPMDDDYGKVKGLDPRDYIQKKNPNSLQRFLQKFDTSKQLLMKIQNSTSSTDRYLDESNPALQKTFKDNPWLALEAQNKKDSNRAQEEALKLKQDTEKRLYESDLNLTRADKLQAFDEHSKHNSKNVEEWLSAIPEGGPKAPIDPSTGKAFETEEVYNKRIARENIIKQAKAASRQAKADKASTYSKSKRKRQQMGADRKSWESYLQDGGFIPRHYNKGDVVEEPAYWSQEAGKRRRAVGEYERKMKMMKRNPASYKSRYGDEAPVDPRLEWNSSAQLETTQEPAPVVTQEPAPVVAQEPAPVVAQKPKRPGVYQGAGLTAQANEQLYAEDPSMRGQSPEARIERYEELFPYQPQDVDQKEPSLNYEYPEFEPKLPFNNSSDDNFETTTAESVTEGKLKNAPTQVVAPVVAENTDGASNLVELWKKGKLTTAPTQVHAKNVAKNVAENTPSNILRHTSQGVHKADNWGDLPLGSASGESSSEIKQKADSLDLKNAKPTHTADASTSAESVSDSAGAPKSKSTIQELASQAEGIGEQTVDAVKDFGQKAYQGAGNFLKKAHGRFGGDAWKASKAMNIEADLNADGYKASNKELAMKMRDEFGEGQGDWEMAKGQGKQRLKDDFETVLGAGVAGVGAAGTYAWDKGKKAVRVGRDWISDEEGYEQDFSKVQSGEARGSNMQRVGKGVGMLGELFKDASQFHGYEGGDWDKYQRPDPKTKTDVDEIDLLTGKKKGVAASSEELIQFKQDGGPITLEGFIQQSWRNM